MTLSGKRKKKSESEWAQAKHFTSSSDKFLFLFRISQIYVVHIQFKSNYLQNNLVYRTTEVLISSFIERVPF